MDSEPTMTTMVVVEAQQDQDGGTSAGYHQNQFITEEQVIPVVVQIQTHEQNQGQDPVGAKVLVLSCQLNWPNMKYLILAPTPNIGRCRPGYGRRAWQGVSPSTHGNLCRRRAGRR